MMIGYNPKDIALCPFQFTDGQGSKHRPVIILSQDREDFLVAAMSTQINQSGKFDIVLEPDSGNGLRAISAIRLTKLITQSGGTFAKKLGKIDEKNRQLLKKNMKKFVDSW